MTSQTSDAQKNTPLDSSYVAEISDVCVIGEELDVTSYMLNNNLGQNTWDKSQNCTSSVFDYVRTAAPFQCCLNQRPFDHLNIELGGKGY